MTVQSEIQPVQADLPDEDGDEDEGGGGETEEEGGGS